MQISGELNNKLEILKLNIRQMESLVVAFSGGVDSTFLLAVALEELGDKVVAVTVSSPLVSKRELDESKEYINNLGVKYELIHADPLQIEEVRNNMPNRCYICKKHIFTQILEAAEKHKSAFVADGSNIDDDNDYRPGMDAVKELGVISPLKEAYMKKEEIRILSKKIGLPTWNKPAQACLATRFPYGDKLTVEKLEMVDRGEKYLKNLGFRQLRVRLHKDIARIEIAEDEWEKIFDKGLMDRIDKELKIIGFKYICLDLCGYKMGSLNQGLRSAEDAI